MSRAFCIRCVIAFFACIAEQACAAVIGTSCLFVPGSTTLVMHTACDTEHGIGYILLDDWNSGTRNQLIQFGQVATFPFIEQIAMSRDKTHLAVASAKGLFLLTLPADFPASKRRKLPEPVRAGTIHYKSVEFSPDGKLLVAGDTDGHAHIYDSNLTELHQVDAFRGSTPYAVRAIAFTKDSEEFAVGTDFNNDMGHTGEPSVKFFETKFGNEIGQKASAQFAVSSLSSFDKDNQHLLAIGGIGGGVELWDLDSFRAKWQKRDVENQIAEVVLAGTGNQVTSGSNDQRGTLHFRKATGEDQSTSGENSPIAALRYSSDSSKVAMCFQDSIDAARADAP